MPMVVFNGLGPKHKFLFEGVEYKDGMIADLDEATATIAISSQYAIPHSVENSEKVNKLVQTAETKRAEVVDKAKKVRKEE